MKSLIFGIFGMLAMVLLAVEGSFNQYLQKHAIYLVVGGTLMIMFLITPDFGIKIIFREILGLFSKDERFEDYRGEIEALSKKRALGASSRNPLINYAAELWSQGIDSNLFIVLLSQKKAHLENDTLEALQSLKNLAKYPPGLGITGTVMGMIGLFSTLDSNKDTLGKNIALAMTATFFGLFLTNVIIAPLADRIQIKSVNRKRILQNLYKVILLINQNEPQALIEGEMSEAQIVA